MDIEALASDCGESLFIVEGGKADCVYQMQKKIWWGVGKDLVLQTSPCVHG